MSESESATEPATESQLNELQREQENLAARMDALTTRMDRILEVALGDRELGEDDVANSADLMTQLEDVRAAVSNHGERLDRLDSAGARGQPGAARKAKIRHGLAKKATRGGKLTIAQAADRGTVVYGYEDVLTLFSDEIRSSYASKLLDQAADGHAFRTKPAPNSRDGRKTLELDISELDSDSPFLRHARSIADQETNEDFAELGINEHSEGSR